MQQSALLKRLRLRHFIFLAEVFLLLAATASLVRAQAGEDDRRPPARGNGFALLEFFTSENCRHCAAGEDTLAGVEEDLRAGGQQVFMLSYHVDYLNSPEWKDELSKLSYSERQYFYDTFLRQNRAEAGQVVINGQFAAPAGDYEKVKRAAYRALSAGQPAQINLEHRFLPESKTVHIEFTVSGLKRIRRDFFYFHAVLLENGIKRFVGGGPNSGVALTHNRAVRVLESSRFDGRTGEGSIDLVLPEALEKSQGAVVCFVQDPQNGKVLAAVKLDRPFK